MGFKVFTGWGFRFRTFETVPSKVRYCKRLPSLTLSHANMEPTRRPDKRLLPFQEVSVWISSLMWGSVRGYSGEIRSLVWTIARIAGAVIPYKNPKP